VTPHAYPEDLADLLAAPVRGAVAFAGRDGPECLPVLVDGRDGVRFGVRRGAVPEERLPEVVTLVVDDGLSWFELRGMLWRGTTVPQGDRGDGLAWYRLDPRRVAAWDYGQVHEDVSS